MSDRKLPNVVFVFGDQWRAQATGYAGDPNVQTPHIDRLAQESINVVNAVAGCPVCSPYRASLITGQHPLTHRVMVNDVPLSDEAVSLADAFKAGGYDTAYIGKWHINAHGRSHYIPPERRQGFDTWKVLECTHDYNHSVYYGGDSDEPQVWEGYDAIAQTRDAVEYIRNHSEDKPFLMVLSWGPPHDPYHTAPKVFQDLYRHKDMKLRPNVPKDMADQAREWLRGYYAHCSALDACVGELVEVLERTGLADDTIFIFTSDHGDMLGSQRQHHKQRPWDESIRVPFLLRYPALFGRRHAHSDAFIDAPDIMPTLLGLCGLPIPDTVEGLDFSGYLSGGPNPGDGSALITCPHAFAQWRPMDGGREYRGLRTHRYTYVRDLNGPWLLYDNDEDPYQLENLVDDPAHSALTKDLDDRLQKRLDAMGDEFLPGVDYMRRWNYPMDQNGAVPYPK